MAQPQSGAKQQRQARLLRQQHNKGSSKGAHTAVWLHSYGGPDVHESVSVVRVLWGLFKSWVEWATQLIF